MLFYDHRAGLKSNLYVIVIDKLFQIFFILDGTAHDYFKSKGNSYRFTCVNCNQSYTAKASLKRHLKYTCPFNMSKITFECPYCDHTTGRKDNLRTHMLTHTDSKSKKKTYLYAWNRKTIINISWKICEKKNEEMYSINQSLIYSIFLFR